MRIGLEVGYDPTWPAGLLYVRNLVYCLAVLPPERRPEVRLLPISSETVTRVRDLGHLSFVELAAPRGRVGPATSSILQLRRFTRRVLQPRTGRVLDKAFSGLDVTYPGWGEPLPGVPQMLWIPDLQHVFLPHLFNEEEIAQRDRAFAKAASSEKVVIFSSHSAREDFLAAYPEPRAHLRVWRFASTMTEREFGGRDPRSAFGLPPIYLYVANQFWAHKGHLTLFEALLLLKKDGLRPHVVCTGPVEDARDPSYLPRLMRFLEEHELRDQVTILGLVDRADQIQIFRHAAMVVQPSTFEGWSTVVEDARALGRPMVVSDIPVHKEQVPDESFFKTGSAESLAEVIAQRFDDLEAGPDESRERHAAAQAISRRQLLAEEFVKIASEAVALERS